MTTNEPKLAISAQHNDQLHKDSLDRLDRLHAVVKTWKSSHSSIASPRKEHPPQDPEIAALSRQNGLDIFAIKPVQMTKDENVQLDQELRLYLSNLYFNTHEQWEKETLFQQTLVAQEWFERRASAAKDLIEKVTNTEDILGMCAKRRVEIRHMLNEAQKGAEECYRKLDQTTQRQNDVLDQFDLYIAEIMKETKRLRTYAKHQFFDDQRKCQILMEHQRMNEDNFAELHGVEIENMNKQMQLIKADLSRKDASDKRKFLQKLVWQIRNLRYEPVCCEKELLQSDIAILQAKLQLLKNDVTFMHERYVNLMFSEEPYSSDTTVYLDKTLTV